MTRRGALTLAGRCVGLGIAATAPTALAAQETQTGLLVSTGISGESNPYNEVGSDNFSVAATLELRPTAHLEDATSSIDVDGYASFRQFIRRYGLEDSYGVNGRVTSRQSERLTLHANGNFAYSDGAYGGYGRPGIAPLPTPGTGTDPLPTAPDLVLETPTNLITDATILGQRTRTTSFGSGIGFDAQLSANSTLSSNLDARSLRFATPGFANYSSATVETSYSRKLSDLMSVGVIGSVGHTNYWDTRVGDSLIYSALLSLDRRFSSRWAVSLAAGGSVAKIRQPVGLPDVTLSSINVRGSFCWQGPYSQLCINASRSPQPSANGNVRVTDAIGANYSLRLSPRERISVGGNYTRTGSGRGVAANLPAVSFISANGRYENQIAERVSLYASANVSKINGNVFARRANFGVSAGLQFRFGAIR